MHRQVIVQQAIRGQIFGEVLTEGTRYDHMCIDLVYSEMRTVTWRLILHNFTQNILYILNISLVTKCQIYFFLTSM